jgi:hypothetical protein
MFEKDDKYNELLHWLAYNFPGTYRMWTDNRNREQAPGNVSGPPDKPGMPKMVLRGEKGNVL